MKNDTGDPMSSYLPARSRECIDVIAAKSGKTRVVLPI